MINIFSIKLRSFIARMNPMFASQTLGVRRSQVLVRLEIQCRNHGALSKISAEEESR